MSKYDTEAHHLFDGTTKDATAANAALVTGGNIAKSLEENGDGVTESQVLARGGEKITGWVITLTADASLKNLMAKVQKEAYGKAFNDGAVFDEIPEVRKIQANFYQSVRKTPSFRAVMNSTP